MHAGASCHVTSTSAWHARLLTIHFLATLSYVRHEKVQSASGKMGQNDSEHALSAGTTSSRSASRKRCCSSARTSTPSTHTWSRCSRCSRTSTTPSPPARSAARTTRTTAVSSLRPALLYAEGSVRILLLQPTLLHHACSGLKHLPTSQAVELSGTRDGSWCCAVALDFAVMPRCACKARWSWSL